MKRKVEVKTFRVSMMCDACGGEVRYEGIELTSNPPQYPHICLMCGLRTTERGVQYPYLIYETLEGD